MIKYYKLKNNGLIAKTPVYFDSFNREFCYELFRCSGEDIRYNFCHKTLFEMYNSILNINEDETGDIIVGKNKLSIDNLKSTVSNHLNSFKSTIVSKTYELETEMKRISDEYSESIGNIEFDSTKRDEYIQRYKEIKSDLQNLRNNKIYTYKYDERDNIEDERYIVPDIKSFTPTI